ncbi:bifunctional diguanylate cyclase/phosphodiesterase [Bacillus sp. PS06]|uniref:bifunctional diguanylate cyclase/phosphodiesterase n=1 Tax=Bacillus sp. PS06 TaxID=2764176 RepID=UPI001782D902|nr:bifunctional diguanylate cyclase/phosphodiesterase [Bacillus sp. PS06]MBD8067870.1 EAL domain-containing protein [Bacillus sp. PS06]
MDELVSVYRKILNSISDFIFIFKYDKNNDSFTYFFANQSAIYSFSLEDDIYGKEITEVLDPIYADLLYSYLKKAILTKRSLTFELSTPIITGELIGETIINPVFLHTEETTLLFSIVRDITKRSQKEHQYIKTQEQLLKDQLRINSLIEYNLDAVYELDLQGRFRHLNKAAEEIVGYSNDELFGKSFVHLLLKEEVTKTIEFFHKAIHGESVEFETSIYDRYGDIIHLELKVIPIIMNGKIDGLYGIAKNISKTKSIEIEKEEIKEQLELVWNNSSDAILLFAEDGIINVNPTFTKIMGYTLDEIKHKFTEQMFLPGEIPDFENFIKEMMNGTEIKNEEVKRVTKDGRVLDFLASYCPVNKGKIIAVAMFRDITERNSMVRSLQASEERYRTLIEASPEPFLLLDENDILYCNPKALELLGAESLEQINGINWIDLIHPNDRGITLERNQKLFHGTDLPLLDRRVITPDGRELTIAMSGKMINFEDKQALLISARDVTERKKAEERANYLALHDDLTGLGNRRLFKQKLTETFNEVKQEDSFAIITLDIDNFKHINDTFGHDVGDEVLVKVSKRLKEILPDRFIICRLGGDEVGIICPDITKEDIKGVAQMLLTDMGKCMETSNYSFKVDLSIGIAMYPEHGLDEYTLKKSSDIALYYVKQTGKKSWILFSEKIGKSYNDRIMLEQQIEEAIINKEFTLHYQPRIDAKTGLIKSVEALLRWPKSSPDVFIPIAEETGQINSIGRWVTKEACRQLKDWQDRGLGLNKISVNLSINQLLHDKHFCDNLDMILMETGLPPECLEFEITERFISNDERVITNLEKCKSLGIHISIDDFGKEYSSLWQLTQLPIDTIKLDRSFIAKINEDEKLVVVIEAILHMAKSLHLKVVGEGVETKDQTTFLLNHDIDELQGFYFCKPVPVSEIEKLLEQKKNWLEQWTQLSNSNNE